MSRIESRDRGANKLLRSFRALRNATLKVGILAKGGDSHGELTVADVATFHEFGLGVPERSFIRGWYDESEQQARNAFSTVMGRVARQEINEAQALGQLGALFVGQIQRRIKAHIPPPLAESTVARKGSSTPLIDTGQLWASVTYTVER